MNFNAYYNGEFTRIDDLKIPLSDRSVYFGDGIYDAFIGRNGRIYLKEEHLLRFFANAERMDLSPTVSHFDIECILERLVGEFSGGEFFLYAQLSRKSEFRSHTYKDGADSNLLITILPIEIKRHDTTLNLITYEDLRYELCHIKTLNLLPSVLASKAASRQNCDEAVFYRGKTVTECAHSNLFILKDGILITHPRDNHILPGITRQRFIEIAKELSVKTVEAKFTLEDLINSDAVIITSTSKLAKRGVLKNSIPPSKKPSELALDLCKALENDYLNATKQRN